MARVRDLVPLRTAVRAWFLISLQTFGGPAGQIAVMQRTLVDERRWIGEKRFLHALNYCMLLPGPEAQQLAIYVGWLLNGAVGGLIAGILFVLPGLLAMLGLSVLYVAQGDTTLVSGLFLGLAPAVLAIVVQAVLRIGARALRNRVLVLLAVAAFLALALFGIPRGARRRGAAARDSSAGPSTAGARRCSRCPMPRHPSTTPRRCSPTTRSTRHARPAAATWRSSAWVSSCG
jgi:chromate transporter